MRMEAIAALLEGFATWDDFDRALPPEYQGSAFACIGPSGVGCSSSAFPRATRQSKEQASTLTLSPDGDQRVGLPRSR
jgi:hypothetical protein